MLMTLIRSRLQARELKPFSCAQVQDNLRFIDFTSERDVYMRFLYVHSFYESHIRTFKIKFKMVSAQHLKKSSPMNAKWKRGEYES